MDEIIVPEIALAKEITSVDLNTEATEQIAGNDGGASDFYPSDNDSDLPSQYRFTDESRLKYLNRAQKMISDWQDGWNARSCQFTSGSAPVNPGFAGPGNAWIAEMKKFNSQEKRWVSKGPVLLYFLAEPCQRLVANYVYGTKSIAMNLRIYEHMEKYISTKSNQKTIIISSMGSNSIVQATVDCQTVPMQQFFGTQMAELDNVFVSKCESSVCSVPEPESSIWGLSFLSVDGTIF